MGHQYREMQLSKLHAGLRDASGLAGNNWSDCEVICDEAMSSHVKSLKRNDFNQCCMCHLHELRSECRNRALGSSKSVRSSFIFMDSRVSVNRLSMSFPLVNTQDNSDSRKQWNSITGWTTSTGPRILVTPENFKKKRDLSFPERAKRRRGGVQLSAGFSHHTLLVAQREQPREKEARGHSSQLLYPPTSDVVESFFPPLFLLFPDFPAVTHFPGDIPPPGHRNKTVVSIPVSVFKAILSLRECVCSL